MTDSAGEHDADAGGVPARMKVWERQEVEHATDVAKVAFSRWRPSSRSSADPLEKSVARPRVQVVHLEEERWR